MAKIHVLESGQLNVYTVVVHGPAPVGSNGAGVPWATALVNSGRARTVLTEGTGAGQITTAEKTAIEAGTTIEGVFAWGDIPNATNPERLASLDRAATQLLAELTASIQQDLRYFGFTRN